MVTINPIAPLPATKIDKAPKTSPRTNPGALGIDRTQADVDPVVERRRDPERRRGRKERIMDQRLGTERRKRSVDISI